MKKILIALTTLLTTGGFAAEKKIVRGIDRFELVYQLTVPELTQAGTLWVPLARTDAHQKFEVLAIHSPIAWHKTRDAGGSNDMLVLGPGPADRGQRISIRYQVTRREKAAHAEAGNPKTHLKAERWQNEILTQKLEKVQDEVETLTRSSFRRFWDEHKLSAVN